MEVTSVSIGKVYAETIGAIIEFTGDVIACEEVQQLPLKDQYLLIVSLFERLRTLYHPNATNPTRQDAVLQCLADGLLPRPGANSVAWSARVDELTKLGQKRPRSDVDDVAKASIEGARVGSNLDVMGASILADEVRLAAENAALEIDIEKLHNDVAQDQLLHDKADNETKATMKAAADEKAELDRQELEASRDDEKNNTTLKRILIESEQLENKQ